MPQTNSLSDHQIDDLDQQFSKLKTFTGETPYSSFPNTNSKKKQVLFETDSEDDLNRTKSLTDDDLDELKGCLDLGFGFSYDEIPELCNTLPALELCYSMTQKFIDEQQPTTPVPAADPNPPPVANWKISSPGFDLFQIYSS